MESKEKLELMDLIIDYGIAQYMTGLYHNDTEKKCCHSKTAHDIHTRILDRLFPVTITGLKK